MLEQEVKATVGDGPAGKLKDWQRGEVQSWVRGPQRGRDDLAVHFFVEAFFFKGDRN